MTSPVNNTSTATLEKKISVDEIVKAYATSFNIDVRKYFDSAAHIEIYRCNDTGYRFYHPFTIDGDSDFYIHFQQYPWYYLPWKWEHEISAGLIQPGDKVLEVGCGKGAFLKRIKSEKNVQCHGLELNESCVLNSPGLVIENNFIETYSQHHAGEFDVVCTFQVLEHIAGINSFIKEQITCLKKGGKLIISVPNNDSLINTSDGDLLNRPPHHMGLWNEQSLTALEKYFSIKLLKVYFEPLQSYHYEWYTKLSVKKYTGMAVAEKIVRLIEKLKLNKLVNSYWQKRADKIKGHTILAVYEKV